MIPRSSATCTATAQRTRCPSASQTWPIRRARVSGFFAPSTHSLLAVCPVPWLLAPVTTNDPTPRWQATGVLRHQPTLPLSLPVRDIRVMYALKRNHYQGFAESQVPHPHEYFVPMDTLTAEDAYDDPRLQALLARANARANFF